VQFFLQSLTSTACGCAGNREKPFVEISEECDDVIVQEETFPTLAVSIHTNYCVWRCKEVNLKQDYLVPGLCPSSLFKQRTKYFGN